MGCGAVLASVGINSLGINGAINEKDSGKEDPKVTKLKNEIADFEKKITDLKAQKQLIKDSAEQYTTKIVEVENLELQKQLLNNEIANKKEQLKNLKLSTNKYFQDYMDKLNILSGKAAVLINLTDKAKK